MKVKVVRGLVTHSDKDYVVGKSFTCSKSDAKHLIDAGFVVEVEEKKTTSNRKNKKEESKDDDRADKKLEALQNEAELLDIATDGKSYDDLLEEVELARELDLEE